jgi:hypothetical protein
MSRDRKQYRILHLTDMHLSTVAIDDYKNEVIPPTERRTRITALESTLAGLSRHFSASGKKLDAVVVSGDVTVAGAADGLARLKDVLAHLGDHLPHASRILVVPGNHDVSWHTKAGSSERYKNFIDFIRSEGYVTPLLDGIDFDPSTGKKPKIDVARHALILGDHEFVFLPVNSSNYCGVEEDLKDLDARSLAAIKKGIPKQLFGKLLKQLDRLRTHDIARVSHKQMENLARLLAGIRNDAGHVNCHAVAVFHHPLGPIGTREEVKAFETITNLGDFQHFLGANDVALALHGHKHESQVYHVLANSDATRAITVISGSTLGGVDYGEAEVARLLVLTSGAAPFADVMRIPSTNAGRAAQPSEPVRHSLRTHPCASQSLVRGENIDAVYEQLLAIPEKTPSPLVCCIEKNTGISIPSAYPEVPGVSASMREQWFRDTVNWWQRTSTALSERFDYTHGERIKTWGRDARVNQIDSVVKALRHRQETSRAVLSLIHPVTDEPAGERKFPQMVSIQFWIDKRARELQLHCAGYFRKQELRCWWPVNVCELALLQKEVCDQLRNDMRELACGQIWTFSAQTYATPGFPMHSIPSICRWVDDQQSNLMHMALGLMMEPIDGARDLWQQILGEFEAAADADPDPNGVPIAIVGPQHLISLLDELSKIAPDSRSIHLVRDALQNIVNHNRGMKSEVNLNTYPRWAAQSRRLAQALKEAVEKARATNSALLQRPRMQ